MAARVGVGASLGGRTLFCAKTLVFWAAPAPAVADLNTVPDRLAAFKVMLGGFGPEVMTPPETVTVMEVGASVVSPKGGWAVTTQVPSGTWTP